MNRFDGTAVRQLDLIDEGGLPPSPQPRVRRREVTLRILRRDIYAELAKRRRRAQIAARHLMEHQD